MVRNILLFDSGKIIVGIFWPVIMKYQLMEVLDALYIAMKKCMPSVHGPSPVNPIQTLLLNQHQNTLHFFVKQE